MRRRVSTTVDGDLLEQARGLQAWDSDAAMMDAALEALAKRHRKAEIDAQYEVYDRIPMDTPDEWGDLESWALRNSARSLTPDPSHEASAES